jgi:hypothetical protein
MKLAGLASAIVLVSLAGTLVVQPTTSHAADECLSGPKGAAPRGSHWYYRVDRATKKNCWYVRAERKQGPSTNSAATLTLPPAETPLQRSVANARAEADPATVGQQGGAAPEPAPFAGGAGIPDPGASAADESRSTVASRWLDQPTEISGTPGPATPAAFDAMPNSAAPSAPPVAAEIRSTSSSAAFPPLLLVIVGALAIAAGVTGVIVKSGRAARGEQDDFRPEQPAPWDVMDIGATIRSPPLATETVIAQSEPAPERHEAVIPDEIVRLLSTLSKEAPA